MSGADQHLNVPGATPAVGPSSAEASSSSGRARSGSGSAPAIAQQTQQTQLAQNQIEAVDYSRQPSIRIERQSSRPNLRTSEPSDGGYFSGFHNPLGGRNRSNSEPVRRGAAGSQIVATPGGGRHVGYMPEIVEGTSTSTVHQDDSIRPVNSDASGNGSGSGVAMGADAPQLRHARTNIGIRRSNNNMGGEYEDSMIDFLDVMDPEVSTLTTLTNVQNSLFVPDLGKYLNRRPTYLLSRRPTDIESRDSSSSEDDSVREGLPTGQETRPKPSRAPTNQTLNTISSRVNDNYYAVLPHGVRLDGWTEEEKLEMNDYVRHMLHSKRSKFRRSMKGFSLYIRKPLGFFVTLYATLITLFGLAWVLFLIGWINVGGKQIYVVHIIDSVLVALFAVVGDGLAPFRAVDTYHMCFIAHYHHLTWRLRREQALPKLQNKSDLPGLPRPADPEKALSPSNEFSVLTPAQQKKLEHHQKKFAKSHSFYKPHETSTHNAFSLRLLVAVVVLLDCHSLLQISLGACTWGIDYHTRPFAITTVILCCSITINITAGILISVGDKRSRKKDVVEKLNKQTLTEEAIAKVERKKERELKKELERRGLEEELEGRKSLQVEGRRSLSLGLGGVLGRRSGEVERTKDSAPPTPLPKDGDERGKREDEV